MRQQTRETTKGTNKNTRTIRKDVDRVVNKTNMDRTKAETKILLNNDPKNIRRKSRIDTLFWGKQGKMVLQLSKEPSARLLKHVVRCYLRLSDNPR